MRKIKFSQIKSILQSNKIDVQSNIDFDSIFFDIQPLSEATINDLSFFTNPKYLSDLKSCKAKACIISEKFRNYLPSNCKPIIVDDPYLVLAYLIELFHDETIKSNGLISINANIDKSAKIHKNVQINPYASIKKHTEIHENVIIDSNSQIGPNVTIGKNCIIHCNVSIANCIIKDNCEIKPGAKIGYAGFGFEEKTKKKIIHIGNVIIENNCTIGSNTTIDRAVFENTKIGKYSQIDNLVHIAHNVSIGKHAIIAAQVGIAGSTYIGDFVKIGGQAGVSGHLIIGNNVTIAAKSGVTKNINDNKVVAGFPAKDIKEWKRDIIQAKKKNDIKY